MQKEKVLRFALLALSLVTSTAHAQEERAIIGPTSFRQRKRQASH